MLEEKLLSQDPDNQDLKQGLLVSEKKAMRLAPPGFLLALEKILSKANFPKELIRETYEYLFETITWETLNENLKASGFEIRLPSPPRQPPTVDLIGDAVQTKLTRLQTERRSLSIKTKLLSASMMVSLLATISFAVLASQSQNTSATYSAWLVTAMTAGLCTFCSCMARTCIAVNDNDNDSDYKRILRLEDLISQLEDYRYFLSESQACSPIKNLTPTQIRDEQRGIITEVDDAITIAERAKEEEARRQEERRIL